MGSPLRVVRGHGDARTEAAGNSRRSPRDVPRRRAGASDSACVTQEPPRIRTSGRAEVLRGPSARMRRIFRLRGRTNPPIGGSAISVIKTLRLLVADLAQKTGQKCTKMPARRCPRTLALLLAAAAPAAVSSEAAHEWAGPQPASKGNKPTRARPRPHRSRDAGIFKFNAGETYTWRAQKVRAGVPPRRARSARPPRRSPATSGRAFST